MTSNTSSDGKDLVLGRLARVSGWIVRPATLGMLTAMFFAFISVNPGLSTNSSTTSPLWARIPLPAPLEAHRAVVVQIEGSEFLYLIGGKEAGTFISNKVYFARLGPDGALSAWTLTSSVPHTTGVREHSAVVVGGRIYVLGGRGDSWNTFSSVYCAKPDATGRISNWTSVAQMPIGLTLHAAAAVDNVIFVIGGYSSQRGGYVREAWAVDVTGSDCSSHQWRPEQSLPRALAALSAVAVRLDNGRKFIYVTGGYDGTAQKSVWRAEVDSNGRLTPWVSLGEIGQASTGLFRHVSAVSGQYLYVIGGTTNGYDSLNAVYRTQIKSDGSLEAWSPLDALPVRIFNHAATVSVPGRIYILGGNSCPRILDWGYFTPLLGFEKSVLSVGPITSGDEIDYALKLTNLGVRDLKDLVITDTISSDASITFPFLPTVCRSYSNGHTVITCNVSSLPLSQTISLTYTVAISSSASAVSESSQTSLSRITMTGLPAKRHNSSAASLEPDAGVDLSLRKSGAPLVIAGETLTYILLVRNEGNAKAKAVIVTDDLPTGVTYQSATPSPDSTDPLRWSLGDLPGEASREIRLVVRVDPGSSGTLINTASVSSDSNDNYPGNNQDEACTVVVRRANLNINKTDNPDPVLPGERLTYTLVVANAGPSNAQDVVVQDFLPSDLAVITTTPPATGGPSLLEWRFDLQAGRSRNIQIVTAVGSSSSGTVSNTAQVFSNDDPFSPKTDQERTAISSRADLGIVKLDYPDPVNPGKVLTYTLLVTNAGPSRAVNVVVTDTLPAGVCSPGPPPNCVKGPLVYSLGAMSNKESRQIQIPVVVSPTITGTLTNQAEVDSDTPDSEHSDNTAWSVTAIMSGADLQLDIDRDPALVVAGATVTYTLTVTNNGPSDALNVTITDSITPPVTVITATPPFTVQAGTPTVITWYVPGLVWGQGRELQLVVRVSPSSSGILTSTAVVGSSTPDNKPGNNQDSDEAPIYQLAGLHIEKKGSSSRFTRGGTLVYTLQVTNEGPSDARNVIISDTLPFGVIFQKAVPPQTSGPSPLVWRRNVLQADGVWTIEVTVVVDPATMGPLLNRACAGSDAPDCDPSDNCDSEQTFIVLVVTNQAIVCEERLWCKESNRLVVIVNPWNIYLPVVVHN